MALVNTTKAAADTLAEHSESLGTWITHHIKNSSEWHPFPNVHFHLPHFPSFDFLGMHIDLSITNHALMLWIAGLILLAMFGFFIKPKKKM